MKQFCFAFNRNQYPGAKIIFFVVIFALMLIVPPLPAQQTAKDQTGIGIKTPEAEPPTVNIRASKLIGRAVQNDAGKQIGDIDDLIIDKQGDIQQVILSVGGYLGVGDKLVAVNFDDLQLQSQWAFRTIRTKDGTKEKIPWEKHLAVVFKGSEGKLLAKPEYAYPEKHPRGGSTGWGVYSKPAGPKSPEEMRELQRQY